MNLTEEQKTQLLNQVNAIINADTLRDAQRDQVDADTAAVALAENALIVSEQGLTEKEAALTAAIAALNTFVQSLTP